MRFPPLPRQITAVHTSDRVGTAFEPVDGGTDFYGGVTVGAGMIGERALSQETAMAAMRVLDRLDEDEYVRYLRAYLDHARRRVGETWRYADIVTVLIAAAEMIEPASYLEIGVRRGRSMVAVADRAPRSEMIGIDLWMEAYAGMDNPGPDHVRAELGRLGFEGRLELLSGDSHRLLPRLFRERPGLSFDLITVDGDHSPRGARRDLLDVLPRLRIGGVLVFDDIRHPAHPALHEVWTRVVARNRRYATWRFDDVGYGVALAVRRW